MRRIIEASIITQQKIIAELENHGEHFEAVRHLEDLMVLIKLRNAYNECVMKGLLTV